MTSNIVSDYADFINTHIDSLEALEICLNKAEALIYLTMREDFLYSPETLIHHYLWIISDLIEEAKKINTAELKFSLGQLSEIK